VQWSHVVRVDLPLREPPRLELGPRFPADGTPVVLTLPLTGSLRVQVRTGSGSPLTTGARIRLTPRGGSERGFEYAHADVRNGAATFPYLDLGLTLGVVGEWFGDRGPPAQADALGPALPGEHVELTLLFPGNYAVVTLRALDAHGTPLADTALDVRVTHATAQPQLKRLRTDADGRLQVEIEGPARTEHPRQLALLERPPGTRGASVWLDAALADDRDTVLGDVVLGERSHEVLAAGVVLDQNGPVAGAEIALGSPWRASERIGTRSDAAGRFELLGRTLHDELSLTVGSPDHLPVRPLSIARGSHDLVLRLERAPRMVIELRVDDEVRTHAFRAQLARRGWSKSLVLRERAEQAVAPGPLDLELRTAAGLTVLRIDGVQLFPDGHTAPSLQPLDLRGKVRLARFELADETGARLTDRVVGLRCAAGSGSRRTHAGGRLDVVVPTELARLVLEVEGCEPREVAIGSGVQPVTVRALED
jgi:hypothetical protein